MHHVALRPDGQRVSQLGKLKLPSLRAKGDVATGARLGNDDPPILARKKAKNGYF